MGFFTRSKSPKTEKVRAPIVPEYEPVDWKKFFKKKRYIPWWILLIVLIAIVVLTTVYHREIVKWLTPVSNKIRSLSWGWIIPILILFIISYPPLFGHEIVAILCGIVYGLWIGFAIVAAGTFLGEVGTYFAFKGFLRSRAEKEEKRNLNYACLATVTREGGFLFVFVARLSAIPSHLTTAVFATCGVSFWVFLIATFLSLPKQLVVVYLGVIIQNPSSGHLVSNIVLGITFAITVLAAGYIYWQMRKVRPRLLAEAKAIKNAGTAYEGAGIEMEDGNHNINAHQRDEEALEVQSPLMPGGGRDYRGSKEEQVSGVTEGRYEPLRSPAATQAPGSYKAYPTQNYSQNWGAANPYNDESRNASAVDLERRPVAGRELV